MGYLHPREPGEEGGDRGDDSMSEKANSYHLIFPVVSLGVLSKPFPCILILVNDGLSIATIIYWPKCLFINIYLGYSNKRKAGGYSLYIGL